MKTTVFIDHCVWDYFFENQLDVATELPAEKYGLSITREAEFEIAHTPDETEGGKDLKPLKQFIKETIARCNIHTDAFFSFFNPELPEDEQRGRGFGGGRFIEYEEVAFMQKLGASSTTNKRPTKLYKNEADISLAGRSLRSVVLTLDKKTKNSPFHAALKNGGKVVFLNGFNKSEGSLSAFIEKSLKENHVKARQDSNAA